MMTSLPIHSRGENGKRQLKISMKVNGGGFFSFHFFFLYQNKLITECSFRLALINGTENYWHTAYVDRKSNFQPNLFFFCCNICKWNVSIFGPYFYIEQLLSDCQFVIEFVRIPNWHVFSESLESFDQYEIQWNLQFEATQWQIRQIKFHYLRCCGPSVFVLN